MKRLVVTILAVLMGLTPAAFAQTQTYNPYAPPVANTAPNTQNPSGTPAPQDDGQSAMAQESPGPSPLLIGGVLVGGAALAIILATQKKNDPVSP